MSIISYVHINLKAGRGCPNLKSLIYFYSLPEFCVKQDCKPVGTNVSCVRVCLVVMTCELFVHVATGQSGRAPLICRGY